MSELKRYHLDGISFVSNHTKGQWVEFTDAQAALNAQALLLAERDAEIKRLEGYIIKYVDGYISWNRLVEIADELKEALEATHEEHISSGDSI
jgi:hypothetical protein